LRVRALTTALVVVLLTATTGWSQEKLPLLRLPAAEIDWNDDAGAVLRRTIAGDQTKPGLYAYRVRFPEGFRNTPHFHPDDRIVTVIEGTLHVGFGKTFDERAMRALDAGSLWTEPGGEPHFVWAKDGQVVIQIIGFGPSATTQVDE
jgi:quercetin dioxygenase-like cupin family protein